MNRGLGRWFPHMIGNIRSNRLAKAAIVVVLALTTTPLMAQTVTEGGLVVMSDAVIPVAQSALAPAMSDFMSSQPVVQAKRLIEERIFEGDAVIKAKKAAIPASTPWRAENAGLVQNTEQTPSTSPSDMAGSAPVPEPVEQAINLGPAASVAGRASQVVQTPAPADMMARTDEALLWALGGGVLLLIGLGGTALVRGRADDNTERVSLRSSDESGPVPGRPLQ